MREKSNDGLSCKNYLGGQSQYNEHASADLEREPVAWWHIGTQEQQGVQNFRGSLGQPGSVWVSRAVDQVHAQKYQGTATACLMRDPSKGGRRIQGDT